MMLRPHRLLVLLLMLSVGRVLAGDVLLPPPGAHLDGMTPAPITVIEPHESKPLKPVEVTYQGYPLAPVLDHFLGAAWRAPDVLVTFEARDGYLSMIPSVRLTQYPVYLVYANARGADFSIETPPLNDRVPLGPWYLVWDNIAYPELRADGATYWPYQVTRFGLMAPERLRALFPPMLPEKYRDGAQLTRQYCLSCHQVNGVGGSKMPIDLAQWTTHQSFARFASWVLDPSAKNPLTTMPALAVERPATERQRMARQIYGYLRAVGALGGRN
ncbi:MAG: cytochrome c [Rhodocyclaceae bacterium]|jgi:mono/diheme cytochrome c family protein|nr:cytochrome c [Rhodocyclaceae bacterium]